MLSIATRSDPDQKGALCFLQMRVSGILAAVKKGDHCLSRAR